MQKSNAYVTHEIIWIHLVYNFFFNVYFLLPLTVYINVYIPLHRCRMHYCRAWLRVVNENIKFIPSNKASLANKLEKGKQQQQKNE